jgi:hypothetical protein
MYYIVSMLWIMPYVVISSTTTLTTTETRGILFRKLISRVDLTAR